MWRASQANGERSELPQSLVDNVGWLREKTPLPICIGFGISQPEHVRTFLLETSILSRLNGLLSDAVTDTFNTLQGTARAKGIVPEA